MPCSAKFRNQNFQISSNIGFMIIRICPPLYTYFPFILGKSTWPQKIMEVSSDSLLPPPRDAMILRFHLVCMAL